MSQKKQAKGETLALRPGGTVTFKYIFTDDYHPEYVNGFLSSVNPQGDIILNFFFERPGLPEKQVYAITQQGLLGEEDQNVRLPKDLNSSLVRQVINGIILSRPVASQLRDQLNQMIEQMPVDKGGQE